MIAKKGENKEVPLITLLFIPGAGLQLITKKYHQTREKKTNQKNPKNLKTKYLNSYSKY